MQSVWMVSVVGHLGCRLRGSRGETFTLPVHITTVTDADLNYCTDIVIWTEFSKINRLIFPTATFFFFLLFVWSVGIDSPLVSNEVGGFPEFDIVI